MDDPYELAKQLNDKLVPYVVAYQDDELEDYLLYAFTLLEDVTDQTIFSLLKQSGLPSDLAYDMRQDAYLRLPDAIRAYDFDRCPVFITYWRRVLRNHLITAYRRRWRQVSIPTGFNTPSSDNTEAKAILQDLFNRYKDEFSAWGDKSQIAVAIDILEHRIFCFAVDKHRHTVIAKRHNLSPSHISNWEKWIREKITNDNPE